MANLWDVNAENLIKIIRGGRDPYRTMITDKAVLDAIGTCDGKVILDAGCGEGYLSRKLAAAGAIVTGIDKSALMISAAAEEELRRPLGISYIKGDLRETGLPDRSFDTVISNHAIYEEPDFVIAFKEFWRILMPQGRFIMLILHPCFYDLRTAGTILNDFSSYFTGRQISKHLEIGGIKMIEPVTINMRSLEYYAHVLKTSGFVIEDIREPHPSEVDMASNAWLRENFTIPVFMLITAMKR
jgi:ubiquinone/menaquinone biosynthesis C-methylase UbiE